MSQASTITRKGVLVLPILVLALAGCTGSIPSQVLPSGSATGQGAELGTTHAAEHGTEQAPGDVVTLSLKFMPDTITVPAGTTVRWVNGERILHTVTTGAWGDVNHKTGLRGSQTPDGLFDHRLLPEGEAGSTFEFTFATPGTYPYYCDIHKAMNGVVIVE